MKPRKYLNTPTVVDGFKFDSKGEAERYRALRLLERAGEITDLELRPRFPLVIGAMPVKIGNRQAVYWGDFRYRTAFGESVTEDFKGMDTPISKLKRALVKVMYGVDVRLVR